MILYHHNMPLIKITQKEFKKQYKPWITDDILIKIKKKNNLFKIYIKCTDETEKKQIIQQIQNLKK